MTRQLKFTSSVYPKYNNLVLTLLRTKTIIPPSRPKRVERPRLIARMHEGMLRALTLVVAPAGFGKTTLVAEWAHSKEIPTAWLSLEITDRSPERFLSYLIQAFQQVEPKIGQTAIALLHGGQSLPDEVILLALINNLSELPHDVGLILDDYHTVDCPEINAILQFLLEHRPVCLHLILASRITPALNLARLRARDQIVEITAADLRFTAAETSAFLEQVMGARLSADQIIHLTQSTEGWAVGLQLAGLTLVRQTLDWSLPAGQAHIFDYLAEEVLRWQKPEVQDFLKKTALFDRFCVSLCEHLLGKEDSRSSQSAADLLAYIERANLFLVPLDTAGIWFRYHALFADFLRKQLSPEQTLALYQAASVWFEQNSMLDDAIHYTIHAGEFIRAADLIESGYRDLLLRGEQAFLLDCIASLPEQMVADRVRLLVAKGWASIIALNHAEATACAVKAEAILSAGISDRLWGEVKALRILTNIFQGRILAGDDITAAFVLLSEQDPFLHSILHFNLGLISSLNGETRPAVEAFLETVRLTEKVSNPLITIIALTQLGEVRQMRGELLLSERTFQQAIAFAQKELGEHTVLLGMPYVSYAELLREQNRFDEALRYAEQGIAYCKIWQPIASMDGYLMLARLEVGRGNWDKAFKYFDQAMRVAANTHIILDDSFVGIFRVRAYLLCGDLTSAEQWLMAYDPEKVLEESFYHIREIARLVLLRAEILRGRRDPAELANEIVALLPEMERRERMMTLIEGLILSVYALHAAGKHAEAAGNLDRALKLGAQCGYRRLFADEGAPLLHLLDQYRSRLVESTPYLEVLLPLLGSSTHKLAQHRDDLNPLTWREMEILSLIALGKSNQQIAVELVLAVTTVKKHVANILGKLDVANRTQAAMAARERGWIK